MGRGMPRPLSCSWPSELFLFTMMLLLRGRLSSHTGGALPRPPLRSPQLFTPFPSSSPVPPHHTHASFGCAGAKWLQEAGRKLGERRCPRPSASSLPSAPPSADSSGTASRRAGAGAGGTGRDRPGTRLLPTAAPSSSSSSSGKFQRGPSRPGRQQPSGSRRLSGREIPVCLQREGGGSERST